MNPKKDWTLISIVEIYHPLRQTIVNLAQDGVMYQSVFPPMPSIIQITSAVTHGKFKELKN